MIRLTEDQSIALDHVTRQPATDTAEAMREAYCAQTDAELLKAAHRLVHQMGRQMISAQDAVNGH
ncbi:hypothetical protein [Bowmanella dokdonensis]|uniref:Uncharacterized protein n=1 Tax=Bowmanella dokdonensis TaxID=751969 RepID=A0A939DL62_9ALTE|nr:hypothetical protein [Bowmanella dokdonensis]MBN7824748.1 hypothetical protein [Bowmanella dokdonensis]